jgi:HEAT repeat protein
VGILNTDEEKHVVFSLLITPGAPFKVRYAVARSIPNLSDGLALVVLAGLLSDLSAKIRGILPVVAASRPFFLPSVAPQIAMDHDWSVRASLASALVSTTDPLAAIAVGAQLLRDGVWQVKLCVLRSLTAIIRNLDRSIEIREIETIRRLLEATRAQYQIVSLKKAIIDLFIVLYTRAPADNDRELTSALVCQEEGSVQLYFLTQAVALQAPRLIGFIEGQLLEIVTQLSKSEHWRHRLGIVDLLTSLIDVTGNVTLKKPFSDLCFKLLKDEATPVRGAAAKQVVKVTDLAIVDGELPPTVSQLRNGTFRDRQAAILLIHELYKTVASDEDKSVLRAQLESLATNVESPNVVSLAESVVRSLTQ